MMDQVLANSLPKPSIDSSDRNQTLSFTGNDDNNSMEVIAQNVIIDSTAGSHNHGSSKVKLKNIVDYNWERRLYNGQLLAVHVDGKFLAYGIKTPTNSRGMVRVAHHSSEKRVLLKGMRGQVQDISFAFITSQVILACIDEDGSIFIHNIELGADNIICTLLINVTGSDPVGTEHRIVWCPYIPDDDDNDNGSESDEDCSKLLVSTHGNIARVWNAAQLVSKYGSGTHLLNSVSDPSSIIDDHTDTIIEAAFSPDGTALATASRDGYVMFFQVYRHNDAPRCMHRWSPHDGKPLSCLFFLDNHNTPSTEQFWKFAVTGAENNSIIKIWSCKSWVCLQTITFTPNPEFPIFGMKAGIDKSAGYLLLSDIHRRALFVLQLDHNSDESGVYCRSVSEFLVPCPILSFGVIDAGLRTFKCPSSCSDPYHQSNIALSQSDSPDIDVEDCNEDNDEGREAMGNGEGEPGTQGCNVRAVVRLYLVQPKSLQEGHITFTLPSNAVDSHRNASIHLAEITSDALAFADGLIDISQENNLSIISNVSTGEILNLEIDKNGSDNQQPLNSILAQQSQQLKNILMLQQIPPGGKQPQSPIPGTLPTIPFAPLLQTQASIVPQPSLNLMPPDAFSSPAKRDEEDPPIAGSPDIVHLPPPPSLPLDSDLHLISQSISIDPLASVASETLNSALPGTTRVFPVNPLQPVAPEVKFASGGSSPSREVQEILSLKGSDCFYDDDFLEENINSQSPQIERQTSPVTGAISCQNNINPNVHEGFQFFKSPDKEPFISPRIDLVQHSVPRHTTGIVETSDTVWPSINMDKINEANQRKANSDKSSTKSKGNNNLNISANLDLTENEGDGFSELSGDDDKDQLMGGNDIFNHKNKEMNGSSKVLWRQVLAILKEQQKDISLLRSEVSALRKGQSAIAASQNASDESATTVRLVEKAFQINQIQLKQMVDTAIANRVETDRANREALLSGVSQIMGAQMSEKLGAAVAQETRTMLVPAMERIVQPFVHSMQNELARKLTATDHLLTENIQKLVNSKSTMENLSASVSHALNSSTKEAFKVSIQTTLVPIQEKALTQMFKQVNQIFTHGSKEHISAFDSHAKRMMDRSNIIDETCGKVNSLTSQMQYILDQQSKQYVLNSQTQQAVKQLNTITKELQTTMSKTLQGAFDNQMSPIRECIREQINSGMAAHVAQLEDSVLLAVRSRNQTPAPSVIDMQTQQAQIEQLLSSSQINAAFQQALSASDLRLVVHACAYADPRQVFCQPCPLQQHVLLSLIQQLGADMTSDTQLKHRYLEEAVMNLDNNNAVTREHMPLVLKELQRQLSSFIASNPYNEATRNLKVLMLATEALVRPSGSMDTLNG